MRRPSNNALDILARSTYNEISRFYNNPKNIEKFELWKKQKKHKVNSPTGL